MNVAHRVHDMNIALDAWRAAYLQNVNAGRRQYKNFCLQKAKSRISCVGLPNEAGRNAGQSAGKYRIVLRACQISAFDAALFKRFKYRLEGHPVGCAFSVKRQIAAFHLISFSCQAEKLRA